MTINDNKWQMIDDYSITWYGGAVSLEKGIPSSKSAQFYDLWLVNICQHVATGSLNVTRADHTQGEKIFKMPRTDLEKINNILKIMKAY